MDKFIIPGFPEQVSEVIETPDIAELLMYPMFYAAHAETVMKHGTEWQKKILDKLPLKNNSRYVTVLALPSIMRPGMRAMTTLSERENPDYEWHIDGNEERSHEHLFPTDTCHLFLAHTSNPTEFNVNPIEIRHRDVFMKNRIDFCTHFVTNIDKYKPEARKAELNKIYTFSNHLHRSMIPDKIEFRYTIRVRETDQEYVYSGLENEMAIENSYMTHMGQNSDIRVTSDGEIVMTPSLKYDYPEEILSAIRNKEEYNRRMKEKMEE